MSARDTILDKLNTALADPALPFPSVNPPRVLRGHHLKVDSRAGDLPTLAARFGEELEKVGGGFDIARSMSEARLLCISHLVSWMEADENARKGMVLKTGQEKSVLCWPPESLGVEGLVEALAVMEIDLVTPSDLRHDLHNDPNRDSVRLIRYGLTGVTAACAATGTMIFSTNEPGSSRSASLLPFRHMALIPFSRLYPHFEAWVAEHRSSETLVDLMRDSANISLITGPSKSADLEGVLTLGVHGPKLVHAILFDDSL